MSQHIRRAHTPTAPSSSTHLLCALRCSTRSLLRRQLHTAPSTASGWLAPARSPLFQTGRSAWHCSTHDGIWQLSHSLPIFVPSAAVLLCGPLSCCSSPARAVLSVQRCCPRSQHAPLPPPHLPASRSTELARVIILKCCPSMSTAAATTNSAPNALNQPAATPGHRLKMTSSAKGIDAQRKPGSPVDAAQR